MMKQEQLKALWSKARPIIGWACIVFGIVGMVLPILQGSIFFVIGIYLVGPRHWLIRRVRVYAKLLLRRWAAVPLPVIGWSGQLAVRLQQRISRQHRRIYRRYIKPRLSQPSTNEYA